MSQSLSVIVIPQRNVAPVRYVHAFSSSHEADDFAGLQEIPSYELKAASAVDGMLSGRIWFHPTETSLRVSKDHDGNGEHMGLLNPYSVQRKGGHALWHVEVSDDGSIQKAHKSYSKGSCRVEYLPQESEPHTWHWTCDGQFAIHCFERSRDKAQEYALRVYTEMMNLFQK